MFEQFLLVPILYVVFGIFEFRFPAEKGHGWRGRFKNILVALVLVTVGAVCTTLIYAIVYPHFRHLPDRGVGVSLLVLLASVMLIDFIFYWYHRAQHGISIFWPIHELHHSDTELNTTTSMRSYWIERPLQTLVIIVPVMFVLGIDARANLLLPFVLIFVLFFTHANIRLPLGPFARVFVGPQAHRIHHSTQPEHRNKNFAQYFPVLDILFGTFYEPKPWEYPPTGTPAFDSDAPLLSMLARPFVLWNVQVQRALRLRSQTNTEL